MTDKFNWYDLENADIVVQPTLGIAVYISAAGYLVIKQEGVNGEDEAVITINPGDIERFIIAVGNVRGD